MEEGKIQTVLGSIAPEELGVTLCHEHLSMSYDVAYTPAPPDQKTFETMPFSLRNLGWIRQYPYSHKPNLQLKDSLNEVVEEMKMFKQNGGGTLVENSTCGLSRNLADVQRISRESGVHVVAGTGYYVGASLPSAFDGWTEEHLVAEMTKDLTSGVGDTGIKCGVIGEVGCSWPLTDRERKSVRATAITQEALKCPVIIHPGRHSDSVYEILRVFQEAGGNVRKTVMSHLDRTLMTKEHILEFARTGFYCEYDLFGVETSYYQMAKVDMPSDGQRVQRIKWLLEEGFLDQIMMAHDVHTKHRLVQYGGHGFSHILNTVIPMMVDRGVQRETLDHILIDNPRRWLSMP